MKAVNPNLNNWDEAEVLRAESTWGHRIPLYIKNMFDFAIGADDHMVNSWLDLGCGFGRFLKYLEARVEEPDYIGYDSSPDMISRMIERFPAYSPRVFCRDIMAPINNPQSSIICSAVFIHLSFKDQPKILNNVLDKNPARFAFDINCPNKVELASKHGNPFERRIKTTKGSKAVFRMTWQPQRKMTEQVQKTFANYDLAVKSYNICSGRHKVVYMLRVKQ